MARPGAVCLVDGFNVPAFEFEQRAVIDGDCRSAAIAAASVLAKVSRDRYMRRAAERHPGWDFETNVGYSTPEHRAAIAAMGVSPLLPDVLPVDRVHAVGARGAGGESSPARGPGCVDGVYRRQRGSRRLDGHGVSKGALQMLELDHAPCRVEADAHGVKADLRRGDGSEAVVGAAQPLACHRAYALLLPRPDGGQRPQQARRTRARCVS